MSHWPDNNVWEERDVYNRAPRPAIIECEPLNSCSSIRWRVIRSTVKVLLMGGFFLVVMVALFYWAK